MPPGSPHLGGTGRAPPGGDVAAGMRFLWERAWSLEADVSGRGKRVHWACVAARTRSPGARGEGPLAAGARPGPRRARAVGPGGQLAPAAGCSTAGDRGGGAC